MRVILKTEVKGLGRVGDVKDVADGYARNYLLPKGLAIEATGAELRQLAQERDAEKAKKDRTHGDAEALTNEAKTEIDRTKVVLHEPLKSLGVHTVEIRLLPDVRANVTVAIEPA